MRAAALALLVAAVTIVPVRWGSFVAGGSDSYCYLHQADRWAAAIRGALPFAATRDASAGAQRASGLHDVEPLALDAPWPDAALTFTPVGHIPSPVVTGAIAPVCPSGLSILMAPFVLAAGPAGAFAVLPIFGGLLVAATYVVGARYGARIGMAAALLVATSPVFLYQIVQPMSDVPAAAMWMLAVAFATGARPSHPALSGLATSAAILIRPNLLPLGLLIGLFLLLRPERRWPARMRAAAAYAAASALGCVAVAAVQYALFGSPLSSGYGSLDVLFRLDHIGPNARRYGAWLLETHTPVVFLAGLAPWLLPGRMTSLLAGLLLVNVALYLPYVVFEDWSFVRFLLPTLPLLLVLTVAALDAICRRLGLRRTGPLLAALSVALAALFVREAIDRQAFRLRTLEARFERAGEFVRETLPANALVLTAWHTGSVRYYAGRTTLMWTALDPGWLDRALAWLREKGYEPYLLFETAEEASFRDRFRASPVGALDWPPAAEIGGRVRIYRPADRARYLAGAAPPTVYAR